MEYDYSIAVEYNNKRINELIETTESNQKRINELTEKINKQDEINKHINNKFRKVWASVNADHLKIEALEAQERAITKVLEMDADDIAELQDAIIEKEVDANQDVINAVLNDFLNDIKKLLNNSTQTIKSDNKTRFVNVHNVELIVDRYINNNNTNSAIRKV